MLKRVLLALLLLAGTVGVSVAQTDTPTATPTNTPTPTATSTGVPVVGSPTGTIPTPAAHASTYFEALADGQVNVDPPSSTGCANVTIAGIQPGDLLVFYPPDALKTTDAITYQYRILMNNTVRMCFTITSGHPPRVWEYVWWDRTNSDVSKQPTPVTGF